MAKKFNRDYRKFLHNEVISKTPYYGKKDAIEREQVYVYARKGFMDKKRAVRDGEGLFALGTGIGLVSAGVAPFLVTSTPEVLMKPEVGIAISSIGTGGSVLSILTALKSTVIQKKENKKMNKKVDNLAKRIKKGNCL